MRAKLEAPIEVVDMTAVVLMIVETTSRSLVGGTTIRRREELCLLENEGLPVLPANRAARAWQVHPTKKKESPAITATGIIDSDGLRERYEAELLWPFFRNTDR